MTVRLVVAVTDGDWFEHLRAVPHLPEVNFWAPGSTPFKALSPGEIFLFKLHSPRNFIVGGGVFAHANTLPCSRAWEAFGEANGASTFLEMRRRIIKYRRVDPSDREDFTIGCRILTQPFFFSEFNWIPVPANWSPNIVAYKIYSTADQDGQFLWSAIQERMQRRATPQFDELSDEDRYGSPVLVKPRLGQGAFRVIVTDAYRRRCVVTGERTLPALEAAHIKPFAIGGSHEPTNGLLLRRDIHALFDAGYVTVSPDLRFEVSKRIKEEFENGRDYYQLHGRSISPPLSSSYSPNAVALAWHNQNQYRG
jgi:putative restriction endonuclease